VAFEVLGFQVFESEREILSLDSIPDCLFLLSSSLSF